MNKPLMPDEIQDRDDFLEKINHILDEVSQCFSVKMPAFQLPDFSNYPFDKSPPRVDYYYLVNAAKRIDVNSVISKSIYEDISDKDNYFPKIRGGALSQAFHLVCNRFHYDIDDFYKYKFEEIDFSPYSVMYKLYDVINLELMRYRLWNDAAIECLENFLFRGDEAYFKVYDNSEAMSFDEFVEYLDSAVRDEFIDQDAVKIITNHSVDRRGRKFYFAEFVPVVCLGKERLTKYFEWRNEIVESLEVN